MTFFILSSSVSFSTLLFIPLPLHSLHHSQIDTTGWIFFPLLFFGVVGGGLFLHHQSWLYGEKEREGWWVGVVGGGRPSVLLAPALVTIQGKSEMHGFPGHWLQKSVEDGKRSILPSDSNWTKISPLLGSLGNERRERRRGNSPAKPAAHLAKRYEEFLFSSCAIFFFFLRAHKHCVAVWSPAFNC